METKILDRNINREIVRELALLQPPAVATAPHTLLVSHTFKAIIHSTTYYYTHTVIHRITHSVTHRESHILLLSLS